MHGVVHFCYPYRIFMLVGKDCIIFVISYIGLVYSEKETYVHNFVASSNPIVYSLVQLSTSEALVLYQDWCVAFMQHFKFVACHFYLVFTVSN